MKKYLELAVLPGKQLTVELEIMNSIELSELLDECNRRYLYYSEQADKYCSSINEKMVYDETGTNLVPKYDKSEILTTEQFYGLLAKMKRCERLTDWVQGKLKLREAIEGNPELGLLITKARKELEGAKNKVDKAKKKVSSSGIDIKELDKKSIQNSIEDDELDDIFSLRNVDVNKLLDELD